MNSAIDELFVQMSCNVRRIKYSLHQKWERYFFCDALIACKEKNHAKSHYNVLIVCHITVEDQSVNKIIWRMRPAHQHINLPNKTLMSQTSRGRVEYFCEQNLLHD